MQVQPYLKIMIMKKWYRIYELLPNGEMSLTDDSLVNWFDSIELAENMIEAQLRAKSGKQYTILAVYEINKP